MNANTREWHYEYSTYAGLFTWQLPASVNVTGFPVRSSWKFLHLSFLCRFKEEHMKEVGRKIHYNHRIWIIYPSRMYSLYKMVDKNHSLYSRSLAVPERVYELFRLAWKAGRGFPTATSRQETLTATRPETVAPGFNPASVRVFAVKCFMVVEVEGILLLLVNGA